MSNLHDVPFEPLRGGSSNEYPQYVFFLFLCRNKKNNVYPYKPQFYYIKMCFKGGQNYIGMFSWWEYSVCFFFVQNWRACFALSGSFSHCLTLSHCVVQEQRKVTDLAFENQYWAKHLKWYPGFRYSQDKYSISNRKYVSDFVCFEVLWPSHPNGVMSSEVSLPRAGLVL